MKLFLLLLPSLLLCAADTKTEPVKVQKANYELAQRWTTTKIGKLVFDTQVTPHWIEGDRFWYSYETSHGRRFMLVDPVKKTKVPLFDVSKMAAMLTLITRTPYDAQHLPIRTIKFAKKDTVIQFEVQVDKDAEINGTQKVTGVEEEGDMTQTTGSGNPQGRGGAAPPNPRKRTLYFEYDLASGKLTLPPEFTPEPRKPAWASMSPDEKTIVFARKNNLWMMDAENYAKALKKSDDSSIVETQLTTDGEDGFSYTRHISGTERDMEQQQQRESGQAAMARDKAGRVPPIAVNWSRDSKKIAVVRRDERKVADLWVIHTLESPRPTLETYKYAMPGDVNVPQPHMEVFDLAAKSRKEMKIDRFKDQFARVLTAPVTSRQREKQRTDPQWLADGSGKLYFERQSRDLHKLDICVANPETGEVTTLIEDRMNTYIESKPLRLIENGEEMLYWSERDGWGHWYLYDGKGALKSQVTSGEFVTEAIDNIDERARMMTFTAEGREPGENPYFTHAYSVKLDGTGMKMLDPGEATHTVAMADDGKYFVDNASRVNTAPHSVLYDRAGAQVLDLETTDISALVETGFKMPEPFSVKADDGLTDLYGVMYKPFDFDPNKKYPIIAYVYPGPQTESVTQVFTPKSPNVGLAQLGFIVIEVGNRGGNPHRSKWYHTYGYGNLRDYGLADKKAAIEELARRHSFIDIERVGITGHSGGGFMSAAAMLQYPDFFKVAVSESGNHENNVYNQTWSEKHHGIKEVVNEKDGSVKFEYNIEKNSEIAKNLKGHLMLTTGDMDDNVHMANTMRLANALIKANKRFDQFILPGIRHSYAAEANYFFWVRADYFCRFLLGDWDQSVDMTEMEAEASPRPAAAAGRGAEGDRNP